MRVQILKRRGLILIQEIEYSAQTTLELEIVSRDPCLSLQWSIPGVFMFSRMAYNGAYKGGCSIDPVLFWVAEAVPESTFP